MPLQESLPSTTLSFIYLFGVLHRFQHCSGHITMGSFVGRGNQYIQLVKVMYCKLPTNGKQLPAFPLEAVPGTEPRPQRWGERVLPLCHRGPSPQHFQLPGISGMGLICLWILNFSFPHCFSSALDSWSYDGELQKCMFHYITILTKVMQLLTLREDFSARKRTDDNNQ